jgi:hypothetical protein
LYRYCDLSILLTFSKNPSVFTRLFVTYSSENELFLAIKGTFLLIFSAFTANWAFVFFAHIATILNLKSPAKMTGQKGLV